MPNLTTRTESTSPESGDQMYIARSPFGPTDDRKIKLINAKKDVLATSSDPALNAAVSTAIIDVNDGVIITLTTAGNDQTLQDPTDTTAGKSFLVSNSSTSTGNINVNEYVLEPGEYNEFSWDGSAWVGNNITSQFTINTSGSGLYEGGQLSINADTTKFDLSAGDGIIIDNTTDHEKPNITRVAWSAFTAQTVTNIATSPISYIAINSNGAIIQQTSPFTPSQHRSLIIIGNLGHPDNTNVTSVASTARVAIDQTLETSDLAGELGTISNGNNYSGSVGDLNIDKSAGTSFREGANFHNDRSSPNITTDSAATSVVFAYGYRDGSGGTTVGSPTTNIDPSQYDDGTGTLASVPVNDFTIQRIFFFPGSGTTFIGYGQNTYNTYAEAKAALSTDTFDAPDVTQGSYLATRIILRNNVASFTDPVTNDTTYGFFQSGILGDVGAGSSSATTTLQQAYNNSVQPQITTNSGLGAAQFKGGTGDNTDNTVEWLNNAGTPTATLRGDGVPTAPTDLTTKDYVDKKVLGLISIESDTAVAVADGTAGIPIDAIINGWNITNVTASVHTKGVTGTTDVQVRRRRAGADVDVLSTKVTIGDEWFASDGVINTSNDDLATGDQLFVDVDAVHSGTAPNGLSISILCEKP